MNQLFCHAILVGNDRHESFLPDSPGQLVQKAAPGLMVTASDEYPLVINTPQLR